MAAPGYAPKGGGSFTGGGKGPYKVVNGMIQQPSAPVGGTTAAPAATPSAHHSFLGTLAMALSGPTRPLEKLGVMPHSVAHAIYGLNAAIPGVFVHPFTTGKEFGVPLKGAVELPYAIAKGWGGQIAHGQIPTSLQAAFNPVGLAQQAGGYALLHPTAAKQAAVQAVTRTSVSKARRAEQIGGQLARLQIDDIKHLYGPHWEYYANHEPLNNFLNVTSVVGGVSRGFALEAAAARLAEEGDMASSRIALALKQPGTVWRESGNFGVRRTEFTTPEGTTMHFDQPYSRSPFQAYLQMGMQDISHRYPNARLVGAMPRVTRAMANQVQRNVSRFLGEVPGMESLGALNKGEQQRLYWGGQVGDYSAGGLQRIRDMLTDTWDQPFESGDLEFDQLMNRAKQAGFGPSLIKNIDLGIKEAAKNPEIKEGGKFDQAITAMRHMNDVNERALLNSAGFAHIDNDIRQLRDNLQRIRQNTPMMRNADPETARLHLDALQKARGDLRDAVAKRDQMYADHKAIFGISSPRFNVLKDAVDLHHASKLQTPEGDALLERLTKQFGDEEQAKESVRLAHLLATRFNPEDPGAWMRSNVGISKGETAEEFMARTTQPRFLAQYEKLPFGGERPDMYISPLDKAVETMQPTSTVQQFRKHLEKAGIEPGHLRYSGIEDWLASKSPEAKITRAEVDEVLRGPANGFHLIEHHWQNTGVGEEPPFLNQTSHGIVSRFVEPNEYHHLAVGLPEDVGDFVYREMMGEPPNGMDWNPVTGYAHHGRSGVAGHSRFSIFTDPRDGLKTMLVDEVQSDWASDVAKEKKLYGETTEYGPGGLTELERRRVEEATQERIFHQMELDRIDQIQFDLEDRMDATGVDPAERQAMRREHAALERQWENHELEANNLEDELQNLKDKQIGRIAPSPLGRNRYKATFAQRLAQIAHDEGVQKTIFASGPTQTARNVRGDAADLIPWNSSTEEIARHIRETNRRAAFDTIYEKDLPKEFAKATGEVGHFDPAAYEGRFSNAYDRARKSDLGPMEGTVFHHGEASTAKGESMRPYYQAAKIGSLPRGALEFLKDGRRVIHVFQDGDISSFVHELAHTAVYDLPEEQQAILSNHYANGAPLHKWTVDAHEAYAQDFERYMAIGKAPTRALEPVFAKIARWMGALWQTVKGDIPDIHPEVREVFDSMFRGQGQPDFFIPHRTTGADILGIGGTRGIPRARREIGDRVMREATSMKRNKLALLFSGTLNPDPRLLVEQTHRVAMLERANHLRDKVWEISQPREPGVPPDIGPNGTQYVVRRAGMGADSAFYDAIENAEDAHTLHDTYANFIDNHITGKPDVLANWETALANDPNGRHAIRVVDKKTVDSLFKNVTGKIPGATTKPATTATKLLDATLDTVRGMLLYMNPGFYVANMLGNAGMMSMADPRALRYLPWSFRQAFRRGWKADPLWHRIAVEMGRGPTSGSLSERAPLIGGDPLRERAARVADGLMSPRERAAAAKAAITRPGAVGRGAQHVSHVWGSTGRATGRVIDDTFRVSAWRQEADKLGYDTYAKQEKLLNDAVRDSKKDLTAADSKPLRDLNSIRDSAEQLMLDFDSMTPFEKDKLTRAIFLYPFMKAATKYPFQYLGKRPIAAGLINNLGFTAEQYANQVLGPPDPNLPAWMQDYARTPWGYMPVSSLSSFQPLAGILASVGGLGGQGQLGVNRPIEYSNPFFQMAIDMARQQSKFGKSQPMWATFKTEFPMPAYLKQGIFGHPPGKIYADRSFLATLERAFRGPFQINPSVAAQEKARGTRP